MNANQDIEHALTLRATMADLNLPTYDQSVRFEMPEYLVGKDGDFRMISYQVDGGERIEYHGGRFSIAPQYCYEAETANATVELIFTEYAEYAEYAE